MKMQLMRSKFVKLFQPGLAGLLMAAGVFAQKAPPATTPEVVAQPAAKTRVRRPIVAPNQVIVAAQSQPAARQVVTVVHQLSGIKMLRLMLRQGGGQEVVEMMSQPLAMASEVQTNIIAGLIIDDGQTIAVWLPQAAAEIDRPFVSTVLPVQRAEGRAALMAATAGGANLSVVLSDGKSFRASYVGLDGTTGVSVLRATPGGELSSTRERKDDFAPGQRVRLLAPQRAEAPANALTSTIYVRVGETQGKLERVTRTSSGKIERLTVTALSLSAAFVGGVALDDSGATIGIVERVEGDQARVLPTSVVESAVRRVLQRRASVPRPLLGVRGERVQPTSRAFLLAHGWLEPDISKLFEKPSGVLLTSVLPGTPAAVANLRPGDVIVRVNEDEVKTEEDFSFWLTEAGSGADVHFTVLRSAQPTPESVAVKLGGSLEFFFDRQYSRFPLFPDIAQGPLSRMGIETFALSSQVASALGAQGGLLVVGVQPESAGALVGVREGDLIEAIDGRPATRTPFFSSNQEKHTLTMVRDRQKLEVVIELKLEKEP